LKCYISPEYSSGNTNDIESVNAYTNTQPDFVEFDNETKRVNLDDSDYHSDTIMSRNNLDHKHTNNSGKLLLNFCKETRSPESEF
jgi:hypothetical protein